MMRPWIWTILAVCLVCLCFPMRAQAAATDFYVRAVIPENQVDKRQTYFDLRLAPGESQTVEVQVTNAADAPLLVYTRLAIASTERNGLILYEKEQATAAEKADPSILDVASLRQESVTVPAGGTVRVAVDIEMPDDVEFDGAIVGGLIFQEASEAEEEAQGIQLQNQFRYIIGLQITQNDDPVEPDFDLASITVQQLNQNSPAVVIAVENLEPRIVKEMQVQAWIYKRDAQEPLKTLNLDSAEMAPQSVGEFAVEWPSGLLQAGQYRLRLRLEYRGEVWEWDEPFTISQSEASAVNPAQPVNWLLWGLIGAGALLVLFLLFFLIWKRRRRDEEEEVRVEDEE
ncbi:MAG: DUF916 and DUF3324 domain-containing protein [Clostridiales bacterium]|nr:DUF916 and DUF3324 domain-containing protein [Clostridiales bacterium]